MYNTIGKVNVHYVRTIQYWTKVLGHFFGYFKKTSYQTQNATMQSQLKFVIERNATFQFLAAFKVVVFKKCRFYPFLKYNNHFAIGPR